MGCSNSNIKNDKKLDNKKEDDAQYTPQKYLKDHSDPVHYDSMKYILKQMESSICKINCKDSNGSGFFCVIPFPNMNNLLPVLFTNNHVLGSNDLQAGKEIEFTMNDDKYSYKILIDKNRKVYSNTKPFDVSIIEMKKKDGNVLRSIFLEVDDNMFKNNNYYENYKQKSAYLIHYPNGKKMEYSSGVIKNISLDNYNIQHYCPSEKGSSGSPIINLTNYKVIGIHKGAKENKNWNLGTLIKGPIDDFNKMFENDRENKEKIFVKIFNINEIKKDSMSIRFITPEGDANCLVKCFATDKFVTVEEKFYEEYPMFRETNNIFLCNGSKITRFRTLKENRINDGDIIMVIIAE